VILLLALIVSTVAMTVFLTGFALAAVAVMSSVSSAEAAPEDSCFFCASESVERRVDGHGACRRCFRTRL